MQMYRAGLQVAAPSRAQTTSSTGAKGSPRTDEKWRVVNQIRKTVRGIGISTRFVPSKRVSDYLKLILLSGLFIMGYEDMKMSRLVELSIS